MNAKTNKIGNYAPDFELPGIDKEVYHLGNYLQKFKAIAVVFMGNDIPEVNKYIERLNQIQAEFKDQGFTLIGIDSNYRPEAIADSFQSMQRFAVEQNLAFPYLRDPTQDVAKSFQAQVMPTVFLLDNATIIRYQGAIDNSAEADSVNHRYLHDNIAALLAGEPIVYDYVEPVGASIQWRKL